MSNNYEGKFVRTPAPAKAPEVKKVPLRRRINRFKRAVKHNRLYQIGLGALACLIIFSSGRVYQHSIDKDKYAAQMEAEIAEVVDGYEASILQLNDTHREEIVEIRNSYENLTPEELIKQEGEYLARMLYAYRNNSERDLRTATWCALNRVDSAGFPNSVKEVCQQPSQWMGYSDDNPILNDLYEIAIKELETWHSNYRPVGTEYVYMSWSSKEISLRNTYEKEDNTRYWQAG